MSISAKKSFLTVLCILFALALTVAVMSFVSFLQKAYADTEYGDISVSPLSATENAKYANTAYKKVFGVSTDRIVSATANGGEYTNGDITYSVSGAVDGNDGTYWYSQSENSDEFKNAVTVTFADTFTVSAILYKSAYFSSGGRQFAGYPRTLNVYASNGNGDFVLAGTCTSEPLQNQSEEVIFALSSGVTCNAIKLEFSDVTTVTNGFGWVNNKKIASAREIMFFQSEGAPLINTTAATGSFADANYLQLNSVSSDELKYRTNGGELTVNNTTYSLSNAFDKKTNTFWCSESANTEEFTNKLTVILNEPKTLDSIVLGCAWSTAGGNRNFYGFPEILKVYTSENENLTLNTVFMGTPNNNSWSSGVFTFPQPVLCKRVVLEFAAVTAYSGWNSGREIAMISEAYLMRAEENAAEISQEVNGIFGDYSQLTLKDGYDKAKINELREQVKNSGNYFSVFKPIFDRADAIADGVLKKDIYREFSTAPDAMNNILQAGDLVEYSRNTLKHSSFGTNRQVTGIGGNTGEKIIIYVDGEENDPLPSVAFTQIYGAWNSWIRTYTLHLGKNEIVFPNFKAGGSYTREIGAGGPIHIINPYTAEQQSSNVKVYIEGGYLYPVFRDGDDESTFKIILADYYERLTNPDDTSITVDAFEAVTGNIMLSCQASLAYSSYVRGGSSPQLNIDKWKDYIRGMLAFGGVQFDPQGEYYNPKNEYIKVNARAVQPYAGMYAFAAGEHIGIIDSAVFGAMVQKWTTGWAFAHEIGHMLDNLNMKIPETTNNMWAIYEIYMRNGAFNNRINVSGVSANLASDLSSKVGSYWDSGHDNCDFWWIIEGGHPGYWANLQRLYSFETEGNALTNATERLAYYSSLATGEDMSAYFERWGFHFGGNSKFTWQSSSDTYKQMIAAAKSSGKIIDSGKKFWYVNNDQFRYTKLHGGTVTADWGSCYNSAQTVRVSSIMQGNNSNTLLLPTPENTEAHLCYEIQSYINNEWKVIGVTYNTSFTDSYNYGNGVTPKYRVVAYDRMFNTTGVSQEYSPEENTQSEVCRIGDVKYDSLRDAVAAASSGNTIYLLKDFKDGNIVVNKQLTILPDPAVFGAEQSVTITKNASGHLFNITSSVTFGSAVNNVPIGAKIILDGNGFTQNGSLVYVSGCTAVLNNVTVQNNFSSGNGGGIYVEYNANVYLNACVVKNNRGNNGGGIFINGRSNMSVRGLELINNLAATSGGGVYISQYTGTSNFHNRDKINNAYPTVKISGNSATNGGGIFANNNVELYGAEISDNSATNGGGVYCDIDNNGRNCMLVNCSTNGNTAKTGTAVYMNRGKFTLSGGSLGGGVYKRLGDKSYPSVFALQNAMTDFADAVFELSELSDEGVVLIDIVTGLGAGFDVETFGNLNVSNGYARFESGVGVKVYRKKAVIKVTYYGGEFETEIAYGNFVLPNTLAGLDESKYIENYVIDGKIYHIGDTIAVIGNLNATATVKDYYVVTLRYGAHTETVNVTQNYVYYLPMKTPQGEVVFGWNCSDGRYYAYAQGAEIVGNTEFNAVIKQLHNVTTVAEGVEISSEKYDYGSSVTLPAPPTILGKVFSHWDIDGKKYSPDQTVVVTNDVKAVAVYVNTWQVTTVIDDSETVEYYKDGYGLTLGGANKLLGREFKYWLINGVKYYIGSTYNVSSDTEIIAVFTQVNSDADLTLTLIWNKGSTGVDGEIVENETQTLDYHFGEMHTFTTPAVNAGNVFLYWEINGVQYPSGASITVTENITANAVVTESAALTPQEQLVQVSVTDYIDGTLQTVIYRYKVDDKILLAQPTANPQGKVFSHWLVNGERKEVGEFIVLEEATTAEVKAVYSDAPSGDDSPVGKDEEKPAPTGGRKNNIGLIVGLSVGITTVVAAFCVVAVIIIKRKKLKP